MRPLLEDWLLRLYISVRAATLTDSTGIGIISDRNSKVFSTSVVITPKPIFGFHFTSKNEFD